MPWPTKFPLRITLLTLITGILLTTIFALSSYNYIRSTDAAMAIADDLLEEINAKAIIEIDSLFSPVADLGQRATELPNLAEKPLLLTHPATWYLIDTLAAHPYIYSVYMGYADDDFYQIISLNPKSKTIRAKLETTNNARYALRRIMRRTDGQRVEVWRFLDSGLRTVGSKFSRSTSFYPTIRPWYLEATATDGLIQTAPYLFVSSRSPGVTVARRFDGPIPGVFGVDLTLSSLCRFLQTQKIGHHGFAFLFGENGALLAHPAPELTVRIQECKGGPYLAMSTIPALNAPILSAVYKEFSTNGNKTGSFRFTESGEEYIGRISPVPDKYMEGTYMAVVAPVRDFTEDIEAIRNDNLIFALILVIVSLPIIIFVSRQITAKLSLLSQEAERIREFDLSGTPDVTSNITEIHNLGKAVGAMKKALQTFGQYMPRSLVAKIVTGELSPHLGGARQDLTILFTDITNFTAISEAMKPEALMHHVSLYFQELSSIILNNNGTIDKFIGDAIMAFWNAPTNDREHVRRACLAALSAARASNMLNEKWRQEGKPELHTRFGLHTGNCIVGNVGSVDRMDYTAMGDAVNIASRLEGLNRHFQTQILVSKKIRQRAGDEFVFRPVGQVVPKGKTLPTAIYELMGLADEVDPRHREQWRAAHVAYTNRQFQEAADILTRLCDEFPHDGLARLFKQRALDYIASPPPDDWNGVELITTK